jgi:hypothetical protein
MDIAIHDLQYYLIPVFLKPDILHGDHFILDTLNYGVDE